MLFFKHHIYQPVDKGSWKRPKRDEITHRVQQQRTKDIPGAPLETTKVGPRLEEWDVLDMPGAFPCERPRPCPAPRLTPTSSQKLDCHPLDIEVGPQLKDEQGVRLDAPDLHDLSPSPGQKQRNTWIGESVRHE
ncbi:hypothetical protein AB1N83_012309 [Pleurotus pulmonarius]